MSDRIQHADALDWLARQAPGAARAVIFDPPYATTTPRAGKEDGAAGTVSGPLSFLHRTMALSARALMPGGIVIVFGDYQRLPDLMYAATTSGLRPSACVAWVRSRPGLGGLLRASWDPGPGRLPRYPGHGQPGRGAERDRHRDQLRRDRGRLRAAQAAAVQQAARGLRAPPAARLPPRRRGPRSVRRVGVLPGWPPRSWALTWFWRGCDIDPAFAEEERHDGTQSRLQPEPGLAARSLPGVRAQGGCTRAPRIPWARSSA